MKNRNKFFFLAILTAGFLTTAHAHQHMMDNGMEGNMMDEATMGAMEEHLSEMQVLLEAVKREQDPEQRQMMLREHAKSMRKMTELMGGESSEHIRKGKHHVGNMSENKKANTSQKVELMEKRMTMMEQMMRQIMGHTAETSAPAPVPEK